MKSTTYFRTNTFGLYLLNGESVVEFRENSKKERVCEFFEEIREENPDERIAMILDNFSSHRAKVAREKAEELGIELVFLPPYSPGLNPIEQIWRILKRETWLKFAETREDFLGTIQETFNELSRSSASPADGWRDFCRKSLESCTISYSSFKHSFFKPLIWSIIPAKVKSSPSTSTSRSNLILSPRILLRKKEAILKLQQDQGRYQEINHPSKLL